MQHTHGFAIVAAVLLIGACDDGHQPTVPVAIGSQSSVGVAGIASSDQGIIDAQSLTLPFSGSANTPILPVFDILQTGLGRAGLFQINNSNNGRTALTAQTNGTSSAGFFMTTNSLSTTSALVGRSNGVGAAVEGMNTGRGRAGLFEVTGATSLPTVEIRAGHVATALYAINTGSGGAGFFRATANTTSTLWALNDGSAPALEGAASGAGSAARFRVIRPTNSSHALSASTAGTGAALALDQLGSGPIAIFQTNGVKKARIDRTGKGFFNGGTQTGGADVAEAFGVEGAVEEYRPGDVLVISQIADRRVRKSSEPYSTRVIGVYATKPGVLLTERAIDESLDDMVPVGVIGVIPTRVSAENGLVRRGDLLVSARTAGHAMRADPRRLRFGMAIGKALEEFDGPGTGVIRVLVNVK